MEKGYNELLFFFSILKQIIIICTILVISLALILRVYIDFVLIESVNSNLVTTSEIVIYQALGKNIVNCNCSLEK